MSFKPLSNSTMTAAACHMRDSLFFIWCQAKISEGKTSIIENAREFVKDYFPDESPENLKAYYYKYREEYMNNRK